MNFIIDENREIIFEILKIAKETNFDNNLKIDE
jgi:hypothetical protein